MQVADHEGDLGDLQPAELDPGSAQHAVRGLEPAPRDVLRRRSAEMFAKPRRPRVAAAARRLLRRLHGETGIEEVLLEIGEELHQRVVQHPPAVRPDAIQGGNRRRLTPEDGVIGTPIYMAPERFTGEADDGRSDVYSVGMMVYEMLAGQLPFGEPEDNPIKVIMKHLHEPPIPLLALCPELPEDLGELVLQALAKQPAERPTARELGHRFAAILELGLPPSLEAKSEDSAA